MSNKRILIETFPLAPLSMTKKDLILMMDMTKQMKKRREQREVKGEQTTRTASLYQKTGWSR